jgi:phosphoglucosamine mutase
MRFGTDGVRGVVGEDLTVDAFRRLGTAAATALRAAEGRAREVLIGWDGRESCTGLAAGFSAGAAEAGTDVVWGGEMATPTVAWVAKATGRVGASITASHNPYAYNGLKLFTAAGDKISDDVQDAIEARVASADGGRREDAARPWGRVRDDRAIVGLYEDWLVGEYEPDGFAGVRVVVDCANGAFSHIAPRVLRRLGMTVEAIHAEPDGRNINAAAGATDTTDLETRVVTAGADIGFAFDGDGDRIITVDAGGRRLDGDDLVLLLGSLPDHSSTPLVVTEWSNLGLLNALDTRGIPYAVSAVGDRNVRRLMEEVGATLGAEQSGHILLLNRSTTGDGLLAGLEVLRALGRSDRYRSLSDVRFERVSQVQGSVRVRAGEQRQVAERLESSADARRKPGQVAVTVRPSGTENLVRIMVQCPDPGEAEAIVADLSAEGAALAGA